MVPGGKRFGGNKAPPMNGLYSAHIVDIVGFQRLVADNPGIGSKRLAKALGCGQGAARSLLNGLHWQQDPSKVRQFNEVKFTTVDEATGIATAEELARYGFSVEEKRAASAAMRPGPPRKEADADTEAVEGLAGEDEAPLRLDTLYFQGDVDRALWRLGKAFSPAKIAKMSGKEIASAWSALLEKRALLRGEPTAIVRSENRGSLEQVGALLLREMARRGISASRDASEVITVEAK